MMKQHIFFALYTDFSFRAKYLLVYSTDSGITPNFSLLQLLTMGVRFQVHCRSSGRVGDSCSVSLHAKITVAWL